jgi:hypothetical protein
VFDLGGYPGAVQPQFFVDQPVAESDPVDLWIGRVVSIEIPRGAAELGGERDGLQQLHLLGQPIHEHVDLLSQPGGRSGLAVGPRQHGHRFPFPRLGRQVGHGRFQRRQHHGLPRLLQRKGDGRIVDVL